MKWFERRASAARPPWQSAGVVVLLFLLIGFVLYWPVVSNGVWVFDDFDYILEDPAVRNPVPYLMDFLEARYIGFLSFAANYAIGGRDPTGYHVFSVFVHVVNALMVCALASRVFLADASDESRSYLTTGFSVAAVTGLLFLVHPMQAQAVAYATQRFASLATLFYLVSVVLYIDARRLEERGEKVGWRRGLYAISVLSCVLAMKTKEIAFTIPVVLAAIELLLFRTSKHGMYRFVFIVPHIVAASLIPVSIFAPSLGLEVDGPRIYERMRLQKQADLSDLSAYVYGINQVRVFVVYLRLLCFPTGLSLQHEIDPSWSLIDPRVVWSSGVLGGIVLVGLWAWHQSKKGGADAPYYRCACLGVVWLFVTASVESSVIPIKDLIFEHRMYLPSAGFFLAVVSIGGVLLQKIPSRSLRALVFSVVLGGVGTALAAATLLRSQVWTDEVGIWDDALRQSPRSFAAYHNRGVALFLRGNYDRSLDSLNGAIDLFHESFQRESAWRDPSISAENVGIAFGFRARVLALSGKREQANVDFNHVRNLARTLVDPGRLVALMQAIAEVFVTSGYPQDAVGQYSEAIALRPMDPGSYFGRAIALGETGEFRRAIEDLSRAIELDSDAAAPAYFNRAYFFDRLGEQDSSRADLSVACDQGFEMACETMRVGWVEQDRQLRKRRE